MTDILAWTDLETPGLDPEQGMPLQVACILTSPRLDEVVAEPLVLYIKHTPGEARAVREGAMPAVQEMHDRTGLWDKIVSDEAMPLAEAEDRLLAYIAAVAPARRQARIAGSSIRFDMNWLERWMPKVMSHLHYRSVDVSGLMYVAEQNLGYEMRAVESRHEALSDIRDSIAGMADVLQHVAAVRA